MIHALLRWAQWGVVLSIVVDKDEFNKLQPKVVENPSTLVISESAIKATETHSKFLKALESRGHTLSYADSNAENLRLFKYGERVYDNVVLFTPTVDKFPKTERMQEKRMSTHENVAMHKMDLNNVKENKKQLSGVELLRFMDDGGNIFVGANSEAGNAVRTLANECGIDFDERKGAVVDHVKASSIPKEEGKPTFVYAGEIRDDNRPIVGDVDGTKVLFGGIAQMVQPGGFGIDILTASSYGYSKGPSGISSMGDATTLVSGSQTLNGARALFLGSLEMCSDEIFGHSSENEKFCSEVSKWVFQEKSVLKWSNLNSYKVGEQHIGQPYMYRMNDDIVFEIDIEEYSNKKWQPYVKDDVQLEMVMLDPYVRLFLDPPAKGSSKYTLTYKAPDVYGIFKFKILYRRRGYNRVHVEHLAPLRNYKHNDYERFIWCASPYYAACLTTPFCVLIVAFFFLFHKEKKDGKNLPSSPRASVFSTSSKGSLLMDQ